MVPTFKMHGSKARTASWISGFIPDQFGRWIEPFTGRGNVLFRVASDGHKFRCAELNDINTHDFLVALRDHHSFEFVDPPPIDKDLWRRWKESAPSPERTLAESYVARFGSSYAMGPNTAGPESKNGHSRQNTIKRMTAAQEILRRTRSTVSSDDYADFLVKVSPTFNDVVYLDPPYDVQQSVHFKGIDHDRFLETIQSLKSWVFISGYSTPRYETALKGWNREVRTRASVGKGASSAGKTGAKPRVEEVLWWKPPQVDT